MLEAKRITDFRTAGGRKMKMKFVGGSEDLFPELGARRDDRVSRGIRRDQ
jgi:hypothetical protein